jgi:hypothetical protein
MATPEAAEAEAQAQARTRRGRLKMLLVLAACAAPVIASYLTYYVVRPEGRSNYSDLILPTRSIPALALQNLDGAPVAASSLRGQWLLIAVGPAACGEACEKRLFMQRQLREMLGRERDRLDKIWLVTDAAPLAAPLASSLAAAPATLVLRAERDALARWLQAAPGQQLEDHLYIVDPLGEWMMRVPAVAEPRRVKRDLDRLLRASGFWDVPGR